MTFYGKCIIRIVGGAAELFMIHIAIVSYEGDSVKVCDYFSDFPCLVFVLLLKVINCYDKINDNQELAEEDKE